MSGLGHFLESEGLATTGVSLVREHAEASRPPRTLCVPFDFGHPFGAPGAVALQTNVLRQALDLFERPEGPVLEDWVGEGGDATEHPDGSAEPWSCPIPAGEAPPPEGRPARRAGVAAITRPSGLDAGWPALDGGGAVTDVPHGAAGF